MTRLVHEGLNPSWKPSDFNFWLTQRFSKAPLVADNLYLSCQGTDINWLVLAVVGCVKTHYFKMQNGDAFATGSTDPDYEKQADIASQHWLHRTSIREVLGEPELLYAYDTVYAAASRFLDGMAARRDGTHVEPLPKPPTNDPARPVPPRSEPPKTPTPEDKETVKPAPETPSTGWGQVVIPIISAIIGIVAGAIGPWGALLKAVWSAIKSLLGG